MEKPSKWNRLPNPSLKLVDVGPHSLQGAEALPEVLEVEEVAVEHGVLLQGGTIWVRV